MDARLHYDVRSYLMTHGNTADKARLLSAGYDDSKELRGLILDELKMSINNDGGIPFGFRPNGPSSVKDTAELLTLIASVKEFAELSKSMVDFVVSRQKNDGGFAEALNLNPYIEDKWGSAGGRDWYPVGKSLTWLTGKALESLVLAGHDDKERQFRARDFLMYSQNEDGHWPDFKDQGVSDPLATGNILEGLDAIGVAHDHKVYRDARAALMQHLKGCLEAKSLFDMADLTAIGKPESDLESSLIKQSLEFILESQREDGGWAPTGSKKSDPELSSILCLVLKRCEKFV
jgi:squalene cyclase